MWGGYGYSQLSPLFSQRKKENYGRLDPGATHTCWSVAPGSIQAVTGLLSNFGGRLVVGAGVRSIVHTSATCPFLGVGIGD